MFKRIMVFVIGLFIMAIGVALSVKADLGVTPISCIPYVYSLKFNFTLGELTIILNVLFIIAQMAILRKKYSFLQLVQLPAITIFGFCIDFALYLISDINPASYLSQVAWCLLSCVTLAFGIFLIVKANITYLPGDGLAVVIADTFHKEFGKLKVTLDSSMVILGLASSFIFLGKLAGIREGTVIAALLVGYLVKICNRKLPIFDKILGYPLLREEEIEILSETPANNFVFTISREYGSGGHEIGKSLAKKLGVPFYDKELINMTAQKGGFTPDYIKHNEQRIATSLLDELFAQNYAYVNDHLPPTDVLFLIQSKIIRDIANKESCVIVGRCANFVLKDNPKCFNIFIHADDDSRQSKIMKRHGVDQSHAVREIERSDRDREKYCLEYTGKSWKEATNYHLTIDSSLYDPEQTAQKIIEFFRATALQHQFVA